MESLFKEKPYDSVITVPNIITFSGIILIGIYVREFLFGGNRWVMFGSLFLAGFSDLADGFLARILKQSTKIGEILDLLRDRLLKIAILAHFLYLAGISAILGWCGLILILQIAIIVARHCLNPAQRLKKHLLRKIKQASIVILFGLSLLSLYFQDVIYGFFSFKFNFPFTYSLPLIALISFIALCSYAPLLRKRSMEA